jgi:hypothetical protein
VSSAACKADASRCGGSTPPVRTRPGDVAQSEERLACNEGGVGSTPTVSTSVPASVVFNGKHAPVVRPRCGFDSCRRLLRTLVAQWKSAALRRQRTLVRFQPGVLLADVAQKEERRSATPERPVRPGPSACADPWCNGSTMSSNLAGPGSNPGGFAITKDRRGPKRSGYLGKRVRAPPLAQR